jgi:hypothetical protein
MARIMTMEQHVFLAFSLIIEGGTEKVLLFIMQLKSICNKNLVFIEQKCRREVQIRKSLLMDIIFAMIIFFKWPFQSCPL